MKLEGAMTAIVTPMRDGAVDKNALRALVEDQIANGIDAIVACGTTGESVTLTTEEQLEVVSECVAVAKGRVPVVAGAGSNDTAKAVAMSKAVVEVGADALLQVVPPYNKPTQEGLFQHFKTIAEATPHPVVLYNVPGRTVCDMLPETVARLAEIDSIVAIKEATGDMIRASKIVELCGDKITLLSGDDFTTFPLYAVGGRGVISVVSNVLPGRMAKMWDEANAGNWDRARELHYEILPLTELLFVESNPVPAKACLELLGRMSAEVRLPLVPCTDSLRQRLRERLAKDGLL
jgi:4-hydroxy-tetrahydrodipicolinate synthase